MEDLSTNQKDRLLNALRKNPVDRQPFICPGGMMTMIVTEVMDEMNVFWPDAHTNAEKMAALTIGANIHAGVENVGVPFCMTVEAEAMGAKVDLGSKQSEPKVIEYAIKSLEEMAILSKIDINNGRAKICVDAIKILKQKASGVPIIANLTGPLSLATSLIEPIVYYRAMIKDKAAARRLADIATENLVIFGDALIEAGADVICIADPSASGVIISRDSFSEFALPGLTRMIAHFRDKYSIPVILHICGKVKLLGRALSDIPADAISVDSVVEINALRDIFSNKVAMGNVSTYLLERGTADSVFAAARNCISAGVDILAPACGISAVTPMENIKSLSRAALPTAVI